MTRIYIEHTVSFRMQLYSPQKLDRCELCLKIHFMSISTTLMDFEHGWLVDHGLPMAIINVKTIITTDYLKFLKLPLAYQVSSSGHFTIAHDMDSV